MFRGVSFTGGSVKEEHDWDRSQHDHRRQRRTFFSGASTPAMIICGLSSVPSRKTSSSDRAKYTAPSTRSLTFRAARARAKQQRGGDKNQISGVAREQRQDDDKYKRGNLREKTRPASTKEAPYSRAHRRSVAGVAFPPMTRDAMLPHILLQSAGCGERHRPRSGAGGALSLSLNDFPSAETFL